MELPLTGISTYLVATAIGEASSDVGTLFLSEKVNEWGFNCPGINNQKAIWGKSSFERAKLSPTNIGYTPVFGTIAGYNLGYFRGYHHDWVTYSMTMSNFARSSYTAMSTVIGIARPENLLDKPNPYPNIFIDFDIEFARILTDFNNGKATLIDNTAFVLENSPYTLTIDGKFPPDKATNGILEENDTFYVKIAPKNVPDRRLINSTPLIISAQMVADTTPLQTLGVRDFSIVGVKTSGGVNVFTMAATIYANYPVARVTNVTGRMGDTSDFSGNVSTSSMLSSVELTKNGDEYTANVSFNFSSYMGNKVRVGDYIFGQISLTNGSGDGGSTIVVDTLPLD